MGAADVVPGVSGGTMAFILGIYERLLRALHTLNLEAAKLLVTFKFKALAKHVDWKFLLALALGMVGAIWFFTHIFSLPHLLETQKARVYAFFFGLVFATVLLLLWQQSSTKARHVLLLFAGAVAGFSMISLGYMKLPNAYWAVFVSGMLAICAMLLPGISGSYLLLLLGQYHTILYAVSEHLWLVIAIFLSGALVGMLLFVRLLLLLLKKFHDEMLFFICGLIVGTMPQLWPLKYLKDNSMDELQMIGLLVLGGMATIAAIFLIQKRVAQ